MSGFSRPADWLRQIFIPSRTGWQTPGEVSPDVSLTHPYDGGAYPTTPPGEFLTVTTQVAAAAGEGDLITLPPNRIARIMGLNVSISAGVLPSVNYKVGIAGVAMCNITPTTVIPSLNESIAFQPFCPILPPTHTLRVRWFGGDAATVVVTTILVARAPLGSVFYV